MGGGSSGKQTVQQNADPWKPSQPALLDLIDEARSVYNSGAGSQYYPGQTWVDPSGMTQQAWGLAQQQGGGTALNTATNQNLTDTLKGKYLDPSSNPYLTDTFNQASQGVLGQLNANFNGSGRFGSGLHQQGAQDQLQNLATNIYGQNYQDERQRQIQASLAAPNAQNMTWQNIQGLSSAGQGQEGYSQNQIQDAVNRWNFGQQAPWQRLQELSGTIIPIGTSGSQSTTTQPYQNGSQLAGAAGGALAGAAAGTAILPGWGTAGGAVIGGLLGAFA